MTRAGIPCCSLDLTFGSGDIVLASTTIRLHVFVEGRRVQAWVGSVLELLPVLKLANRVKFRRDERRREVREIKARENRARIFASKMWYLFYVLVYFVCTLPTTAVPPTCASLITSLVIPLFTGAGCSYVACDCCISRRKKRQRMRRVRTTLVACLLNL